MSLPGEPRGFSGEPRTSHGVRQQYLEPWGAVRAHPGLWASSASALEVLVLHTVLEVAAVRQLGVCPVTLSEVCSVTLGSVSACLHGSISDVEETQGFQLVIYVLFLLYIQPADVLRRDSDLV